MTRAQLRCRPLAGLLGLLVGVAGLGLAAQPAGAFGIPIQVSPDGFDIAQFPTLSANYVVPSPLDWLPAGGRSLNDPMNPFTLLIDQSVTVTNNPYAQTPAAQPSESNPFTVQIDWTVENNTAQTFDNVLLFLPRLVPPGPDAPDYTSVPVQIQWDPASFVIVQFPDPNTTLEYYLGFLLQDLSPGAQASVSFQYSVLAPLPPDPTMPGSLGAPLFEVAAATRFVPEPALTGLLLVGLAGLAARRTRRCA
jgi:hypothetical protein